MLTKRSGNKLEVYLDEGEFFMGHEPFHGGTLSANEIHIPSLSTDIRILRPHNVIITVYTPAGQQIDQKADGTLIYEHAFHDWRPYTPRVD